MLVTVSDKKFGVDNDGDGKYNYYVADVLSATDYYPFGMTMPGRSYVAGSSSYRYGFNGMEKDNDLKGEGLSYTTEYRAYDPRLGKWFSVDPKANVQPWGSPYAAMCNSPLWRNDPNGDIAPLVIWALEKLGEAAIYVMTDVAIQAAIEHYIGGKDWKDVKIDWWAALGYSSEAIIPGKKAKIAFSAGWDMLSYTFQAEDWNTQDFVMAGIKGGISAIIGDRAGA